MCSQPSMLRCMTVTPNRPATNYCGGVNEHAERSGTESQRSPLGSFALSSLLHPPVRQEQQWAARSATVVAVCRQAGRRISTCKAGKSQRRNKKEKEKGKKKSRYKEISSSGS